MKKLWDKGKEIDHIIEKFTVGQDRELDLRLAEYDVKGTIAHIMMLKEIGMISQQELTILKKELNRILEEEIKTNKFQIEEGVEDVHSQVELMLTENLGAVGKKIHTGRSRNDQVLLDLRLFYRDEIKNIVLLVQHLFDSLIAGSEKYKEVLLPGYTHTQAAMPSSFGLWFGAYAESLVDDLVLIKAVYDLVNRNPLGSAAGYGSSFPLDRDITTELLNFDGLNINSIYAQMGRGKVEQNVAFGLAGIATTLNKLATDVCLYNSQNFNFLILPEELTTGSSIMPHKKNPDVFELIRAKTNIVKALPNQIAMATTNLISGYHRDYQILKELIFPALSELKTLLQISQYAIDKVKVNPEILEEERYNLIYSVEEVNKLILEGYTFRDAYRKVAEQIDEGIFNPSKEINHHHIGSLGNLGNNEITSRMSSVLEGYK